MWIINGRPPGAAETFDIDDNIRTTVALGRTFSRGRVAHQFLPRLPVEDHGTGLVRIAHPANWLRVLLSGEKIRCRIHRHHLAFPFKDVLTAKDYHYLKFK